jgi:hypothetical protein
MNTQPNRPRLNFDFGNGSLTAVDRDGKQFVAFRDLCRFVGADYATELDTARNNGVSHYLRDEPDGAVLLELETVPMWLMICEGVAEEHREGHRAFIRSIMDAKILEPVAQKYFPELFEPM